MFKKHVEKCQNNVTVEIENAVENFVDTNEVDKKLSTVNSLTPSNLEYLEKPLFTPNVSNETLAPPENSAEHINKSKVPQTIQKSPKISEKNPKSIKKSRKGVSIPKDTKTENKESDKNEDHLQQTNRIRAMMGLPPLTSKSSTSK